MPRSRQFRKSEPEEELILRTSAYPLGNEQNDQLMEEIEALVDPTEGDITCEAGEVRITRLTHTNAAWLRGILNRPVLDDKCTLNEVK